MKPTLLLLLAALALSPLHASPDVKAGPRKGRLIEFDGVRAEFLVTTNRVVSFAFYDDSGRAVPPGTAVMSAVAEAPAGKVRLAFEPREDRLESGTPLPPGEGYQVVVQARARPDAKPHNFRIKLELHPCDGCSNPEYACTCGH
jgi:hypothetical protein